MNRRHFATLAAAVAAIAFSPLSSAAGLSPQSFEAQMRRAIDALNARVDLTERNNGTWVRSWMKVSDVEIDVLKSDSALRPYVGTFKAEVTIMFGAERATRAEAAAETEVEAAPSVPSGKNQYSIKYDLKFAPKGSAWEFWQGKSITSLRAMMGDAAWFELTPANIQEKKSVHTIIIGVLSKPPTKGKSSNQDKPN